MTYKINFRTVSIIALIGVLPFLTGCLESNFQPYEGPESVVPPPPPPPAGVAPGTVLDVNTLTKGLCADTAGNEVLVDDVTVRDCNGPHEFEVAGLLTREEIMGLDFPGRLDLISKAQMPCEDLFADYTGVGYFDSELEMDTITPSANTWAEGDRTVICLVVGVNGALLTQSAAAN